MMKEYVLGGIARILEGCTILTPSRADNNFILVLPEVSAEEADCIAHQLEENVREKMKIRLQVGTANFPDEAMTFESLVELALKHASEPMRFSQPRNGNQSKLGDVGL
jgi:hypothetical protein